MIDPTTSLDLPASLQALFQIGDPAGGNMQAYREQPMGATQQPMMGIQQQEPVHGFAMGGMVSPTGAPVDNPQAMPMQGGLQQPGGQPQQGFAGGDVQAFIQQNPEAVQQMNMVIQEEIQAGNLDPQDLTTIGEMASLALDDMGLYPQVRQALIQQGAVEEGDLPADPEAGSFMLFLLAAAAQSLGAGGMPAQEAMPMQGEQMEQPEMQNFADGGYVKPYDSAKDGGKVVGPGTGTSDSIPINVSAGEYVVPAHIVQAKGKEFFDSMLNKYRK